MTDSMTTTAARPTQRPRDNAAQPLPTDPRLTTGECENGLSYVVVKHVMPPGRAWIWLHIATGSLQFRLRRLNIVLCGFYIGLDRTNFARDAVQPR